MSNNNITTGNFEQQLKNIGSVNIASTNVTTKNVGDSLGGRISPQILPKGSYQKLPEAFEFIIKKLDSNPRLVEKINGTLTGLINYLWTESREFELFTQAVPIPKKIDQELMQLFGVNVDSLRKAADKIGFSLKNRMYSEPYYITLSILYYYGCKTDNKILRQLSLILILVRLYRGRISRYWKKGSDPVTTKFVMTNRLRNTSTAKKYPNTFKAIILEWTPKLDEKYWLVVKEHPAHELRGISSILTAAYTRINQMYVGLANHYYKAFEEGHKTGAKLNPDDLEEKSRLSLIGQFVENIYTAMIYQQKPISDQDKNYIRVYTNTSNVFINAFEKYTKDPKNSNELKEAIESILKVLEINSKQDFVHLDIERSSARITSSKTKKDQNIIKAKEDVQNILKEIYPSYVGWAESSRLAVTRAFVILLMLKIKQPFDKKEHYMRTTKF